MGRRRGFFDSDSWGDDDPQEQAYFDQAAICRECGSVATSIVSRRSAPIESHCTSCGGQVIRQCDDCQTPIRGYFHSIAVSCTPWRPASNCHQCGARFPWVKSEEPAPVDVPPLDRLLHLLGRFHAVARRLKKRHGDREPLEIKDEYDVQDLLEALLEIDFEDVRREEPNPSHGGKGTRTDFFLAIGGIAIEVKKTRKSLTDASIFNQLLADIARYKQRDDYRQLVCFIYDPDELVDRPTRLIQNLQDESTDALQVIAVIVPRR